MDSSDLGGKAGKYRMDQKKIDRINELARRKKSGEALTEEEQAEHQALRREYVQSVLGNLDVHLANTYLVDEHGNKRKLTPQGTRGRKERK